MASGAWVTPMIQVAAELGLAASCGADARCTILRHIPTAMAPGEYALLLEAVSLVEAVAG
ncbi:MAG: hypothetical protein KFB97_01885 [Cyanobium sp. M30B3]|nr:MAG: hypothetical protein KFB97_01885 [Cyanobium sp. M30B3]